jgi:hypothetical protein
MRATTSLLCITALGALGTVAPASEALKPEYSLKRDQPPTGSLIRERYAWTRLIPLDRPYDRFTTEQKLALKALYEPMPEDDEPPFPEGGLGPVVEELSRVTGRLRLEGTVRLHITVNSEGKATEFRFYKMPDQTTGHAVAYVFAKTKFKPARCGGQPCQMDFPFTTELRLQ